ncbi:hypothetical protein BMT54_11530 [Pasteurellaceae bacterium 15-036681]|nr:hypothetical protein BMT54_11530 [Pasteurellaceae bacterium 15-036681]
MIYEFGFKNYFSFKEGASISFRKSEKDSNDSSQIYSVMGIKGANASGKTHIIKGLSFLADFCIHSFSDNTGANLKLKPFFASEDVTDFYIEFRQANYDYLYEISAKEERVMVERLSQLTSGKIIFDRKEDIVEFSNDYPEFKLAKFRNNASVISTLKQYELHYKDINIQNAFDFFSRIITNVWFLGFNENGLSIEKISQFYQKDPELFSFVKDIIIKNDLGIIDVKIHQMYDNEKIVYFPVFLHGYKDGENEKFATLVQHHESSGTLRLYTELWKYFDVLSAGGILALDEFDKNFHALILPTLLELFENKEINTKNAQFLFTAHNTEIMDYLGKYRTILVQKEDGESFCYRLDEIEGEMLVDGKAISPLYLSGRLGGVPNL